MRQRISGFSIAPLALLFPMAALAQLGIMPASQSVSSPGDSATYMLTVTNPTGTSQTFVPSTSGIPTSWGLQLPASVTVAAGGSKNFNVVLTTPFNLAGGPYPFMVIVNTLAGPSFSVPGTIILAANRTFVATTGNDSNIATDCGSATPCRTFGVALSATNPGGELVVLNSGGYGPATISQPVIITAIGVDASISVTTSGANGLTINTAGNVTLIGLNLHGEATGNDGILVNEVGFLRLYNMLIENFTSYGVYFPVSGNLAVYGSEMNDNALFGLGVNNDSANAYVQGSSFDHNTIAGAGVGNGQLTIADSGSYYNGNGFRVSGASSILTLINDRAAFNTDGLWVDLNGKMYLANCLITNNTTAYNIVMGTLQGTNPGTSLISPGQATSGTLGTAIALQ